MKNVSKKSKKGSRIKKLSGKEIKDMNDNIKSLKHITIEEEVVSENIEPTKENELSLNKNKENLFKLLKVLADIDERLAGQEAFRYIQDILSLIINDKNKEQKMEIISLLTKFIMGE